jgi:DNA-binding transcriptional LysR family regulator
MKQVNMATVDLNLLKTFLAIWEMRSLTGAADRLHLSQPAVSHALRRLREIFDDPLFVRASAEMIPTTAAMRLHGPIDHALAVIFDALKSHSSFEPALATRTFRLAMSDMVEQHLLPLLMEELAHIAPRLNVEVRQLSMPDLNAAMKSGEVDIALGYLPGLSDECVSQALFDDEFICLVRNEHPLSVEELTVDDMNGLRYVHAETRNSTGHNLAENALQNAGVRRNIALTLPHFTVATGVVARTDLALIIPKAVTIGMNKSEAFRLLALPVSMPKIAVGVHTHSRFASDPGIAWMAALVQRLLTADER